MLYPKNSKRKRLNFHPWRITLLAGGLLLLSAMAQADLVIVDTDSVPKIRPQAVVASDVRGQLPEDVKQRLKIGQAHMIFSTGAYDPQPNESYRQVYVYPEMERILTHPPEDFQSERLGVDRIEGFHRVWPEGASGAFAPAALQSQGYQ